jgi:hypothetical protein
MKPCPAFIDGTEVVCYAKIPAPTKSDDDSFMVASGLQGPLCWAVVTHYADDNSFYLFGCDRAWQVITDSYHATLNDALTEASYEYEGIGNEWVYPE